MAEELDGCPECRDADYHRRDCMLGHLGVAADALDEAEPLAFNHYEGVVVYGAQEAVRLAIQERRATLSGERGDRDG